MNNYIHYNRKQFFVDNPQAVEIVWSDTKEIIKNQYLRKSKREDVAARRIVSTFNSALNMKDIPYMTLIRENTEEILANFLTDPKTKEQKIGINKSLIELYIDEALISTGKIYQPSFFYSRTAYEENGLKKLDKDLDKLQKCLRKLGTEYLSQKAAEDISGEINKLYENLDISQYVLINNKNNKWLKKWIDDFSDKLAKYNITNISNNLIGALFEQGGAGFLKQIGDAVAEKETRLVFRTTKNVGGVRGVENTDNFKSLNLHQDNLKLLLKGLVSQNKVDAKIEYNFTTTGEVGSVGMSAKATSSTSMKLVSDTTLYTLLAFHTDFLQVCLQAMATPKDRPNTGQKTEPYASEIKVVKENKDLAFSYIKRVAYIQALQENFLKQLGGNMSADIIFIHRMDTDSYYMFDLNEISKKILDVDKIDKYLSPIKKISLINRWQDSTPGESGAKKRIIDLYNQARDRKIAVSTTIPKLQSLINI